VINLLDTTVVSELRKPGARADTGVHAWAGAQRTSDPWLSVITVKEVEIGGADRAPGRAARCGAPPLVGPGPTVGIRGSVAADRFAVTRRAAGLHVPDPSYEGDVKVAATALQRGMTVVTRNSSDVASSGVERRDPCSA